MLEELIEERRRLGLDGHDEVWEGEHHLAPHAHTRHGLVEAQLAVVLGMRARAAGSGGPVPSTSGNPTTSAYPMQAPSPSRLGRCTRVPP